ncbi:MAG: hypothetical protein EZS28_024985, partial [Streblomastix strix]
MDTDIPFVQKNVSVEWEVVQAISTEDIQYYNERDAEYVIAKMITFFINPDDPSAMLETMSHLFEVTQSLLEKTFHFYREYKVSADSMKTENEMMKAKLQDRSSEHEIQRLRSEVESRQRELELVKSQKDHDEQALRMQIRQLTEERDVAQVKARKTDEDEKLHKASAQKMALQIDDLTKKNKELTNELNTYLEQIQSLEAAAADNQDMAMQKSDLQQENEQIKADLIQKDMEMAQLRDANTQMEEQVENAMNAFKGVTEEAELREAAISQAIEQNLQELMDRMAIKDRQILHHASE